MAPGAVELLHIAPPIRNQSRTTASLNNALSILGHPRLGDRLGQAVPAESLGIESQGRLWEEDRILQKRTVRGRGKHATMHK